MKEMKPISNFRNKLYQVAIILLLAYAALSTAMKDLDRLQEIAGNMQSVTANGLGGLARVYSATKSLADGAEMAQAPNANPWSESPRVNIIDAGGSIALAGRDEQSARGLRIDKFSFKEKVHSALACPLRKRELPKAVDHDFKWNVVAQVPERMEVLRTEFSRDHEFRIATLIRRGPRVRAIINKVPAKSGKADWSNVSEFKSLSDVIGFGLKHAQVEAAETERLIETAEEASRNLSEFKRTVGDSENDDLATHE